MCLVFCGFAAASFAGMIAVDENFEGTTAFVDQHFPIEDLTTVADATQLAKKGVALRGYSTALDHPYTSAMVSSSGTLTTDRHFLGAKSMFLSPTGTISEGVLPSGGVGLRCARVKQFAISASTETLPAVGTKIGYFKSDWTITTSTASTTQTNVVEASLILNFVVGNSQSINVVCQNTGAKVGAFPAGRGGWGLVSIITNNLVPYGTDDPKLTFADYTAWTSGTPQSVILISGLKGPSPDPSTTTVPIYSGSYVFLNTKAMPNNKTKTSSIFVSRSAMGVATGAGIIDGGWGNDNTHNAGVPAGSCELGWSLVATAQGGGLYVDNVYQDSAYHDITGGQQNWEIEEASRMQDFNQASNEPRLGSTAGVKAWELY